MTQLEKCVETMKEKYKEDDEYELYSEKFKEFVYNFEKIIIICLFDFFPNLFYKKYYIISFNIIIIKK